MKDRFYEPKIRCLPNCIMRIDNNHPEWHYEESTVKVEEDDMPDNGGCER